MDERMVDFSHVSFIFVPVINYIASLMQQSVLIIRKFKLNLTTPVYIVFFSRVYLMLVKIVVIRLQKYELQAFFRIAINDMQMSLHVHCQHLIGLITIHTKLKYRQSIVHLSRIQYMLQFQHTWNAWRTFSVYKHKCECKARKKRIEQVGHIFFFFYFSLYVRNTKVFILFVKCYLMTLDTLCLIIYYIKRQYRDDTFAYTELFVMSFEL